MIGVAPGGQRVSLPPYLEGLPFTGPYLLAPMEGVTEPCFRDVVLELHDPTVPVSYTHLTLPTKA